MVPELLPGAPEIAFWIQAGQAVSGPVRWGNVSLLAHVAHQHVCHSFVIVLDRVVEGLEKHFLFRSPEAPGEPFWILVGQAVSARVLQASAERLPPQL